MGSATPLEGPGDGPFYLKLTAADRQAVVECPSIRVAKVIVRAHIDRTNWNWTGGEVYQDGRLIGIFSPNGRLWSSDGQCPGKIPVEWCESEGRWVGKEIEAGESPEDAVELVGVQS